MALKDNLKRQFRDWRIRIFTVAWITYALFYITRANLSIAIPGITQEFGYSKTMLGSIGSALFATYAIGQFTNGQLGDKFGARKLVTIGIIISALANLAFGFTATITAMVLLWSINGYFQSTGWPLNVKTIANWFPLERRGTITGLYGSCYQAGNALSWLLSGYLASNYGWRYVFWVPALIFGLSSLLFYFGIRNSPESVGLPSIEEFEDPSATALSSEKQIAKRSETKAVEEEHLGFSFTLRRTFGNPKIWIVGIAFIFLDVIRYGFFIWAPTYLFEVQKAEISIAAYKTMVIPIAGSLGAISAGWLTQKHFGSRRGPPVTIMLVCLGTLSWLYPKIPTDNWILGLVCLAMIGYFTYGPHVTMVAAIPMDFGTRKGAASATGFIDGLGYIGAFLTSIISGILIDNYGWGAAFNFWIASAFIAAGLMITLWKYKPQREKFI
jgi:sugar phosphate permease